LVACVLSTIGAALLTQHTAFLQWHGSGMENPFTHVFTLATVLILSLSYRGGTIWYPLAGVVFLATISRLESVYHVAPLLGIFSVAWFYTYRTFDGYIFALIVCVLWAAFHLWRFQYFGDLTPNTGYAQGLFLRNRLTGLFRGAPSPLGGSLALSLKIAINHGGYLLLLLLPLMRFVRIRRREAVLFLMISSLVVTAVMNPVVFGQTRLDPVRTTTHLAPVVALALTSVLYSVQETSRLFRMAPAALLVGMVVLKGTQVSPYYLCCRIASFDTIRAHFAALAERESLPRPTVANPDLGIMSGRKQFNVLDLGMLGTPMMAKLTSAPVLSDYFFDYAAPDLIESHGPWSCRYESSIFEDPRFRARYVPVREARGSPQSFCDGRPQLDGIWMRIDVLRDARTPERLLIDDLAKVLSIDRLRDELRECQIDPDANCVYVARVAFRFLPEFRSRGEIDGLNAVFSGSRTRDFDLFLINGYRDPRAHLRAIRFLSGLHRGHVGVRVQ
jgi:hypothetical protein